MPRKCTSMEFKRTTNQAKQKKSPRFKAIKFAAIVFSFASINFSVAAKDMISAENTANEENSQNQKKASGTISVSLAPFFYAGLGTECKESHIKKSMEEAEKAGFASGFDSELNGGINASFLWKTPFLKQSRMIFAGADFSYFNRNGFKAKIDSAEYEYSYRSLELSPFLAYRREFESNGKTSAGKNPSGLFFSFSLGANFSFPLGKADYRFKFLSEDSDSFEIKTFCVPGILCSAEGGFRIKDFEIFISVKYINDFSPVKYSPHRNPGRTPYASGTKTSGNKDNGNADELMTRRCVLFALGVRYLF